MIKLSVKILITTILTMLLFLCIPNYRTDSDNSIKEIEDMTN